MFENELRNLVKIQTQSFDFRLQAFMSFKPPRCETILYK
jgi:hypothetical protein